MGSLHRILMSRFIWNLNILAVQIKGSVNLPLILSCMQSYNSTLQVPQVSSKKSAAEIPTPQFVVVDTYERDYSRTFGQPTSYLRARGGLWTMIFFFFLAFAIIVIVFCWPLVWQILARAEIGEFIEYDLDNEDEDWLQEFNRERKILPAEK